MSVNPPVPTDVAHAAAPFVSKHCVALLRPDPMQAGRVAMVGSGTLVRLRGRRFILTATHVWQALRNHSAIHYALVWRTEFFEFVHWLTIFRSQNRMATKGRFGTVEIGMRRC